MLVAVLLLYAVAGHFGVMLSLYNVLNSTGLPRKFVKITSKLMVLWTLALPLFAAWQIFYVQQPRISIAPWIEHYALTMIIVGTGQMVRWVLARPGLEPTQVEVTRGKEQFNVATMVDRPLARTAKCRLLSRVAMNQMFELSIEHIELPVVGLPSELDGFKISHLSDIHFTGHIDPAMTRVAMDHANRFEPDLFALTGDIIDHADCLAWLPGVFGDAVATHGCHFILGNHDKRHGNTDAVRAAMIDLGWNYLGGRADEVELANLPCELIGNEFPWYPKPVIAERSDRLRILLSHSPDQIHWAGQHHVTLMLAGHTHGGQGRLPWIGPLIAPSRHGTRFASGDFYLPPTTMHVTRGLSGTHLLRINCPPEVSLITLRVGS